MFYEFHPDKTKSSVGWQIAMNAKIGLKLQVTATLGFHSYYDWCHQTMWLLSYVPDDPEDDTVLDKHGAEVLNYAVQSWMHVIRTEDEKAQQDAAHRIIQIAMPWVIIRWSKSKIFNSKPLVLI